MVLNSGPLARDIADHHIMHRAAPTTKNFTAQNADRSEAEKSLILMFCGYKEKRNSACPGGARSSKETI